MDTNSQEHSQFEFHRRNLAYFWSFFAALSLAYIIIRWGDRVEILTLIIGLIGGTIIGGIFSVFFVLNNKNTSLNQSADKITNSPAIVNKEDTPEEAA